MSYSTSLTDSSSKNSRECTSVSPPRHLNPLIDVIGWKVVFGCVEARRAGSMEVSMERTEESEYGYERHIHIKS